MLSGRRCSGQYCCVGGVIVVALWLTLQPVEVQDVERRLTTSRSGSSEADKEFASDLDQLVGLLFGPGLGQAEILEVAVELMDDFMFMVPLSGIWCAAQLGYALVYKNWVVDRKHVFKPQRSLSSRSLGESNPKLRIAQEEVSTTYSFLLFDCWGDGDVALHTSFCCTTRVADTYHSAGIMDFWVAFFVAMCCPCCFAACLMPCKHGQLRTRLNGSATKACGLDDMCMACYCTLCVACQEARSVDQVVQVKVRCCCILEPLAEARVPLVVGELVSVRDVHGQQHSSSFLELPMPDASPTQPSTLAACA
eukprot:6423669-Amphidinium_carterae.2